jgi:DNA-binding NarL/FixJ family response regulator
MIRFGAAIRAINDFPYGGSMLTLREREIANLVCDGLSNKEIARKLTISEGTVKVHLHRIYEKLVIRNRTMLAVMESARLDAMMANATVEQR